MNYVVRTSHYGRTYVRYHLLNGKLGSALTSKQWEARRFRTKQEAKQFISNLDPSWTWAKTAVVVRLRMHMPTLPPEEVASISSDVQNVLYRAWFGIPFDLVSGALSAAKLAGLVKVDETDSHKYHLTRVGRMMAWACLTDEQRELDQINRFRALESKLKEWREANSLPTPPQ